jgi:hypothetical protein
MLNTLNLPQNLSHILREEGVWEDESFAPILITVEETVYKGKDILGYQMEFPSWENLGQISDLFESKKIILNGYEWHSLILEFVKSKNRKLVNKIHDDSESETCVLWTKSEKDFVEMMTYIFELINNPPEI